MVKKKKVPMTIDDLARITAGGFADVQEKFTNLNQQFKELKRDVLGIDRRLTSLEDKVDLLDDKVETIITNHEHRLVDLEKKA